MHIRLVGPIATLLLFAMMASASAQQNVGIKIDATPEVQADNTIRLNLSSDIEVLGVTGDAVDGLVGSAKISLKVPFLGDVPELGSINSRELNTSVTLLDQPSLALGGLLEFDALDFGTISEIAVFGGLTFSGPTFAALVGSPPPALRDAVRAGDIGGVRTISNATIASVTGSAATSQAQVFGDTLVGVRLEFVPTVVNDTTIVLSIAQAEGVELDSFEAALTHRNGPWTIAVGGEAVDFGVAGSEVGGRVRVERRFGSGALGLSAGRMARSAALNQDGFVRIDGFFQVTDTLGIGGQVASLGDNGDAYGLFANYMIAPGALLQGGITDLDGEQTAYVGLKILANLLQRERRAVEKSELLIFVAPQVVDESEGLPADAGSPSLCAGYVGFLKSKGAVAPLPDHLVLVTLGHSGFSAIVLQGRVATRAPSLFDCHETVNDLSRKKAKSRLYRSPRVGGRRPKRRLTSACMRRPQTCL